nr:ankyrin repeat domain-containing protein [Legionella jordanis]
MGKVILIYANCKNPTAKGDFAHAGVIARDLARELPMSSNINVVLTSTLDGIKRFESLYGKPDQRHLLIDGECIGICALETFDPVENTVVAFIEANRCNFAPAELVKRVISPQSKFLFVGAANQKDVSSFLMQLMYRQMIDKDQPDIYSHFAANDILIGSSGLGSNRLGLPNIEKADNSDPGQLSSIVPSANYGFMYLAAVDSSKDYKLIAQYMKLTDLDTYVLVGNFTTEASTIKKAYASDTSLGPSRVEIPKIQYHQSLPNKTMRLALANSYSCLVLSTGVMSTLEAMRDSKLTYYQNLSNNNEFVASYLMAVKSIVDSDSSLIGAMPDLIFELSKLLFKDKPLSQIDIERTQELLAKDAVTKKLVQANEKVIAQVNGKLAPGLLSFLNESRNTSAQMQLNTVCTSLRKQGETTNPVYEQALRRAAAWGRLFELKVLVEALNKLQLNSPDPTFGRSALHWACLKDLDCARLLIQVGVELDAVDNKGQTALHYAASTGNKELIKMLLGHGASPDLIDLDNKTAKDYADAETAIFISTCCASSKPVDGLAVDIAESLSLYG